MPFDRGRHFGKFLQEWSVSETTAMHVERDSVYPRHDRTWIAQLTSFLPPLDPCRLGRLLGAIPRQALRNKEAARSEHNPSCRHFHILRPSFPLRSVM